MRDGRGGFIGLLAFAMAFVFVGPQSASAQDLMDVRQIRNFNLAGVGGDPGGVEVVGGQVFFSTVEPARGNTRLWVTDVATSATRQLVKAESPLRFSHFTKLGNFVYYLQGTDAYGSELWRTDGTAAGTQLVRDVDGTWEMVRMGDRLYFQGGGTSASKALWVSDGTPSGSRPLTAIDSPPYGSVNQLTVIGDRLVFRGETRASGVELWTSDGTAAGTHLLADATPGTNSGNPQEITLQPNGNAALLTLQDPEHGRELWRTDGTTAGTSLVRDLVAGTSSGNPVELAGTDDGYVYFSGYGGAGSWSEKVWRTDGTSAGTEVVTNEPYDARDFVSVGSLTYFAADGRAGDELWRTDGTATGTELAANLAYERDDSRPRELTELAGQLYFTANADGIGENGVRSLYRVNPLGEVEPVQVGVGETSAKAASLTVAGPHLYFKASSFSTGAELWRTRPLLQPELVLDSETGNLGGSPFWVGAAGQSDYFLIATAPGGRPGLFASDGTNPGTRQIHSAGHFGADPKFTPFQGDMTYVVGRQLWRSDGTDLGTVPLTPYDSEADVLQPVRMGGALYFLIDNLNGLDELWRSDGTALGTELVVEVPSGTSRIVANDRYLFYTSGYSSAQLWRSDGTTAGTVRLGDPNRLGALYPAGDLLYFRITDGVYSTLYATDGSSFPTEALGRWRSSDYRTAPQNFEAVGDRIFFSAQDADVEDGGTGEELWISDGTPGGTHMVEDISPDGSTQPFGLIDFRDEVFFTGTDGCGAVTAPRKERRRCPGRTSTTPIG